MKRPELAKATRGEATDLIGGPPKPIPDVKPMGLPGHVDAAKGLWEPLRGIGAPKSAPKEAAK